MTTIGLIGAGHIGSQIARLAAAHGYAVVISNSRGPDTLSEFVTELGPNARAATEVDAAEAGDLVRIQRDMPGYGRVAPRRNYEETSRRRGGTPTSRRCTMERRSLPQGAGVPQVAQSSGARLDLVDLPTVTARQWVIDTARQRSGRSA